MVEGEFAQLPTALAAHASILIDDRYLLIYGGTNGLRFFDNIIRYDIERKEWTLMTKFPPS
jgi:Galactose oxidase, central domain